MGEKTSNRGRQRRKAALNRTYSLKRNKEFQRVYRRGKAQGSRAAVMIVCRARHTSVRVGFSVGKKLGNAVARNRIKRRAREAFRAYLPRVKCGVDIIVVAREGIVDMPFLELKKTMRYLLKKSDLLCENGAQGASAPPRAKRQHGSGANPKREAPGSQKDLSPQCAGHEQN